MRDGRIRLSWVRAAVDRERVVGLSPGYRPMARSLRMRRHSEPVSVLLDSLSGQGNGDFTWELYFKLDSLPPERFAVMSNVDQVARPGAPPVGMSISVDESGYGGVQLWQGTGPVGGLAYPELPLGTWVHLAVVLDRYAACSPAAGADQDCTHLSFFVNSIRRGSWYLREGTQRTGNGSSDDFFYGSHVLTLGDGARLGIQCSIARVRIYRRILGPEELGACAYSDANATGLVFNADFDGTMLDLASGVTISTVPANMDFPEDVPPRCLPEADSFYHDLSGYVSCGGICGNGLREFMESCDVGRASPNITGCSEDCSVQPGYACSRSNEAQADVCLLVVCGDSILHGTEDCDDGNEVGGDGCSAICLPEAGYRCLGTGPDSCATVCGDGRRAGLEECDDENIVEGDGCDNCTIARGFTCDGGSPYTRDFCRALCGDGFRVAAEECDDENRYSADGCSPNCEVEAGYVCAGGDPYQPDQCHKIHCGDGVLEGMEECDDHNLVNSDGCSSSCILEAASPATSSEVNITVLVMQLPQACRVMNEGTHHAYEDTIYHLREILITGDVDTPQEVSIAYIVENGFLTLRPLLNSLLETYMLADAISEALVKRETGVSIVPYSEISQKALLVGTASDIDYFLRNLVYIQPVKDFVGFVLVKFAVVSGIRLNYGAENCEESILIRYDNLFEDDPAVWLSTDLQKLGIICVEATGGANGPGGCEVPGLAVYDPDCASVVDGSCYLRMSVTVSAGGLVLPGAQMDPQAQLPVMEGHPPGLNAALARMRYVPPEVWPSGQVVDLRVQLERVVRPTVATPPELREMSAEGTVHITVPPLDTPPTLRWASGEAFHGSMIQVRGQKPFIVNSLVFEGPGLLSQAGGGANQIAVELKASRGYWFLGTAEGLFFEDGTVEGGSRLQFRANTSALRSLYLSDIRYAWDDSDCANLEEFNVTFNHGLHGSWTLRSMLQLPDCPGYSVSWHGGVIQVEEDSMANVDGINLSSSDKNLFVVVDIRHPTATLGDCRLEFWPADVSPFVPGRECHLDGTVAELANTLTHMVYQPPPNFFGDLQVELLVQRTIVENEVSKLNFTKPEYPVQSLFIDVHVVGVNDAPELDIYDESQAIKEDPGDPVFLSRMFVSDIDAEHHPLMFVFELVMGAPGNTLHMCELHNVLLEDPLEYMLDEDGCLNSGAPRIQFRATTEVFNSMQRGAGRLQFLPAADWYGAAVVNISINDLGSGLGEAASKVAWRSLKLMVEPVVDQPHLTFTCSGALPFTSYGHTCLEVRDCVELSAGADENDNDTSMRVVVAASHPGVSVSIEHSAPVRIDNEGMPTIQITGLYRDVQQVLQVLVFHPPANIFRTADDPDTFSFEVSLTAVALGQTFADAVPVDVTQLPRDDIQFPVIFRRVNKAPSLFVDLSYFLASQLDPAVAMPGIAMEDGDARSTDEVEVTLEVNPDSAGGAIVFAGVEAVSITKRMPLEQLNRELRDLRFLFQDEQWFGVTGVTVSVSDLGNRGWTLETYDDMYHRETVPQVLTLEAGVVNFFPEETKQYHALYAGDLTWEVYCKRRELHPVSTASSTTPASLAQAFQSTAQGLLGNSPTQEADKGRINVTGDAPGFFLFVDPDGQLTVTLQSDAGLRVGGRSRVALDIGTWRHVAVVLRRTVAGTTTGEVALYLDGVMDTAWLLVGDRASYGPSKGNFLVVAGGQGTNATAVSLSRARLWGRALEASELGRCDDPPSPVASGPQRASGIIAEQSAGKASTASDADLLAFSFGLMGSLAEAGMRVAARPSGVWSFDADSPPRCLDMTQIPYNNVFEYCTCYDKSLQERLLGTVAHAGATAYFWHSPQAYSMLSKDLNAFANHRVQASRGQGLSTSTVLAVYRRFVGQPPMVEPAPLVLVCPAGIDVAEGAYNVLIASNISVSDLEPIPGKSDVDIQVQVDISVSGGGLGIHAEALAASDEWAHLKDLLGIPFASSTPTPLTEAAQIPALRFDTTLGGLRLVLAALTFSPPPAFSEGVVLFFLKVTIVSTGEQTSCNVGIVTHRVRLDPVPEIIIDEVLADIGRSPF